MNFKNPFFYITMSLALVIVGTLSYKLGQGTTVGLQMDSTETNPIVALYNTLSPQAKALYFKQSDNLTKPVPTRLVELDQKTIGCFGPSQVLSMTSNDENLGGQCCGALTNFKAYELQLQALSTFIDTHGGGDLIPADPYDVPVSLAKELTQYDTDIVLTADDQVVYDEALSSSHHGPCCCKCWKWYMMSGLAKKLIEDEGWNARQVAQMWDLSSSCGHSEDTNMHEHYAV
jgi:hypothetical protein